MRSSFAPEPVPAWFVDAELDELRARPELLGAMVRLALDDSCAKLAALAPIVRAPTLMIHGTADALVDIRHPRRLFEVLRAATPARFVGVPGGHMVHLTHPERVTPVLDEWLVE